MMFTLALRPDVPRLRYRGRDDLRDHDHRAAARRRLLPPLVPALQGGARRGRADVGRARKIVEPAAGTLVYAPGASPGAPPLVSMPFVLADGGRRLRVHPRDTALRGCRRLIAGRCVTVHGVVETIEHGRPHLYREAPIESALTAVRITAGRWPDPGRLVLAVAGVWVVGLLVSCASLLH